MCRTRPETTSRLICPRSASGKCSFPLSHITSTGPVPQHAGFNLRFREHAHRRTHTHIHIKLTLSLTLTLTHSHTCTPARPPYTPIVSFLRCMIPTELDGSGWPGVIFLIFIFALHTKNAMQRQKTMWDPELGQGGGGPIGVGQQWRLLGARSQPFSTSEDRQFTLHSGVLALLLSTSLNTCDKSDVFIWSFIINALSITHTHTQKKKKERKKTDRTPHDRSSGPPRRYFQSSPSIHHSCGQGS